MWAWKEEAQAGLEDMNSLSCVLEGRSESFWRGGETRLRSSQTEAIWEGVHILKA